jgi:hypothetical protein
MFDSGNEVADLFEIDRYQRTFKTMSHARYDNEFGSWDRSCGIMARSKGDQWIISAVDHPSGHTQLAEKLIARRCG